MMFVDDGPIRKFKILAEIARGGHVGIEHVDDLFVWGRTHLFNKKLSFISRPRH
jgi:hypothetical protein